MDIKAGDIVRVTNWCKRYPNNHVWFNDNYNKLQPDWVINYSYGNAMAPLYDNGIGYVVLYVDHQGYALITELEYYEHGNLGNVWLIDIDGIELHDEPTSVEMTISETENKNVISKIVCEGCEYDKYLEHLACCYCQDGSMYERRSYKEWIPVKTRPLTEEEREEMPFCAFLYDCPLPEPEQEVFITTNDGRVATDTLCMDEFGDCYFEVFCNANEVVAWMPLPEPYKEVVDMSEQIPKQPTIPRMPEKKSTAKRQDIMIRATKSMGVTKDKLFEVFYTKGISGVFNFGLEVMYKYLKDNEVN